MRTRWDSAVAMPATPPDAVWANAEDVGVEGGMVDLARDSWPEGSLSVRVRCLGRIAGVQVDRGRFEQLVADALDGIPEELGALMENVAVVVEEWPTPEQLGGTGGTLLGLYEGVALTRRSPLSYAGTMPDRITIFRGPISERAADEEGLVELVVTTVIHEVAHHFGISDARLEELGWC